MSLQVWLPLNGDLHNQGVLDITGTNYNSTVNTAGKIGSCYYFNGSNMRIEYPHDKTIWNNKEISICMWYKWAAGNEGSVTMIDIAADLCLTYAHSSSGLRFGFWRCYNNNGTRAGSSDIIATYYSDTEWHHVVLTCSGGINKIYVDGILVQSFDKSSNYTANWTPLLGASYNKITIGKSAGSNPYASGYVNDVRIYDHCLSAAEVKEISQGLVLHYKLDSFQQGGNPNLLARYVVPGQAGPTSTANGGRTIWAGDYKIIIPASENADTYFRLFMTEQLTANTVYTISCEVSGLLTGSQYNFPLFAQSNTSMGLLTINHNGLCSLTFTMTWTGTQTAVTGANGETVYVNFLDDASRTLASGQGPITLSNFKLEKGTSATAWCPSGISDNIIEDNSGYNHNGTINGNIVISSDTNRYNCSAQFDGVDDSITVPYNAICPENIFTFNLWFKKDALGSKNYETLFGGPSGFEMDTRAGSATTLSLYMASTRSTKRNLVTELSLGNWYMITMTRDGTKEKYYVNGIYQSEIDAKAMPIGVYRIGAWASNTGQNYYGLISDFRIYATALSAADVLELYHTGAKIDNKANFHTYEINENSTNKLTKTGIMYDNMVESIMTLPDGSHWQLLMFHYVDNGNNLFTKNNALYCNDFGLFSRLQYIDNFKYTDTTYEFYVIQDGVEYRWTQTNAPTATSPSGFSAVSGYANPVQGLVKNGGNTYFGYNSWWGACGCWTKWSTGGKSGIPGFGPHDATGTCSEYLALYARIPKVNVKLSNQTANSFEFIEL